VAAPTPSGPIPLLVVSGFLGSGKTTLIRRLLAAPGVTATAVIVNEFGQVGIDHHLLTRSDERTTLLPGGCVCCGLRPDLVDALRDLLDRHDRGLLPPLDRIVLETTGLADPAPILQTLAADPLARRRLRLERVVVALDAQHGARTLAAHGEATRQVAAADLIAVTKTDLAPDAAPAVAALARRINPAATILGLDGPVAAAALLAPAADPPRQTDPAPSTDPTTADDPDTPAVIAPAVIAPPSGHGVGGPVASRSFVFDRPLDWEMFALWLTLLLHRHGDRVLRVKGLLNVGAEQGPLLLEGVQHVVHAPRHLAAWPDADRRSRLVVITRGLDPARIEASLAAFQAAARR